MQVDFGREKLENNLHVISFMINFMTYHVFYHVL